MTSSTGLRRNSSFSELSLEALASYRAPIDASSCYPWLRAK